MRYGEAGEAFASGPGEGEGRGEQNEGGTHHVEIIAQRRWRWLPRQDWWGRHFAESATRTRLPYGRGCNSQAGSAILEVPQRAGWPKSSQRGRMVSADRFGDTISPHSSRMS